VLRGYITKVRFKTIRFFLEKWFISNTLFEHINIQKLVRKLQMVTHWWHLYALFMMHIWMKTYTTKF
jgi:hypothetical protein